jgi:hypothetical protein
LTVPSGAPIIFGLTISSINLTAREVNVRFPHACRRWQLRDGEPDRRDDGAVVAQLERRPAALHDDRLLTMGREHAAADGH